jgi:hypothetical protein
METLIMDKSEQSTISFKQRRKYNVNDCFFETPNIVNCYYAGFIAADGCIRKYKGKFVETYSLSFGLSIKDKDFLIKFLNTINYEGTIRYYENKGRKYVGVEIKSNKICEDLRNNFNITERKTHTLCPPNLFEKNLIDAFICGYIDGDGSVYFSKNKNKQRRVGISIIGTDKMLSWIINRFCEIYGKEKSEKLYENKGGFGSTNKNKKVFTTSIYDRWARTVILNMSEIDVPKMERKWSKEIIDYCNTYKKALPICKRKGVNSFNLNGEFLKHYDTLKEASDDTGVSVGRISSLCKINDNTHMAHGFMFSRNETINGPYKQDNPFSKKRIIELSN